MALEEPLSLYTLLNRSNDLLQSYEALKASYESLLNDYETIKENGILSLGSITASATTLDSTASASAGVTIISESDGLNKINFHFGIPKGEKGDTGATGTASSIGAQVFLSSGSVTVPTGATRALISGTGGGGGGRKKWNICGFRR